MTTRTTKAQDDKFLAEAEMFRAQADAFRKQVRTYEIGIAREEKNDALAAAANDQHNIYHFFGGVDDGSAYNLMRAMERFTRLRPGQPIEILFTSPGGSILAGLAIIDHIAQLRRQHKVQVTTVALGMAASMAGILLQSGDVRVMGRESWLLIHEASFMAGGSYGEVMDTIDWVGKIQERIVDLFVDRTKGKTTRAQFKRNWKRKDWWLSASDALAAGFIDEIR
ncbi:MAG TPA: ATP-dependent Clp protease proteolytic subunit [Candidatus Dormibacteraeota bacterium]|jgi:ATP-dependent Clp protease protease subunit